MPRNGSGVYSPTAGVPVVSGTTISSTAVNNVLDDLGDEITASLPVSGVAPMTGVLRVTAGTVGAPGLVIVGDTNTGIYSPGADQLSIATGGVNAVTVSATQTTAWSAKAVGKAFDVDAITDVASATTCDIGAAATSEVNITGTTTITSFGTSNAGIVRRGTFAGALTLTHNGTSLILPGAANITTAAGDSFVARSLGSGNWRVLSYQPAVASPFGSRTLLASGTSTSAATLDLTLTSGFVKYELEIIRCKPATDAATLNFRVSTDSGSSYIATGYVYSWISLASNSTTPSGTNHTASGSTSILLGSSQENTDAWGSAGVIEIYPPVVSTSETVTQVRWRYGYFASVGESVQVDGFGGITADPPTNVRLLFSSGNIAAVTYRLYGII